MEFPEIEQEIDNLTQNPKGCFNPDHRLLALSESIFEHWLWSKGIEPTNKQHEGFRLLALHRQGAIDDPSLLACRETCRELIYLINVFRLHNNYEQIALSAMVAMHLLLFIRGKMETEQLGEFCCSSKAIRNHNKDL